MTDLRFISLLLFALLASGSVPGRSISSRAPDESRSFVGCAVAMSDRGTVVVVAWTMPSAGGRVLLTVTGSEKSAVAEAVWINKGLAGYGQNADVTMDERGMATVVWEQFDGVRSDVCLAQVTSSGAVLTAPRPLRDPGTANAFTPRVASAGGSFAVAWQAFRADGPVVLARRFSADGKESGGLLEVSQPRSNPMYPSLDLDTSGRVAFVWQEGEGTAFHVMARTSDAGGRWGVPVVVDSAGGTASASNPDVRICSDLITVVWKDYRTGEANVYLQRFSMELKAIGGNLLVNDDSVARWQRLPRIEGTDSTGFVVVWEDYRHNAMNQVGDIYAQRYERGGTPAGRNFRVNRSPEPSVQEFPSLAMDGRGRFVVAWIDGRKGTGLEVYAQKFSETGSPISEELVVFPQEE